MQSTDTDQHSFIVKIWLEERDSFTGRATWRGSVAHLPWGERRYVSNLTEIIAALSPYLDEMGARPKPFWRLRRWLLEGGRRRTQETSFLSCGSLSSVERD